MAVSCDHGKDTGKWTLLEIWLARLGLSPKSVVLNHRVTDLFGPRTIGLRATT